MLNQPRLLVLAVSLSFCACSSKGTEDRNTAKLAWPPGVKDAYVQHCAASVVSQGIPEVDANSSCQCFADELEREFGLGDYEAMRQAEPDSLGDHYDRRLYEVVKSCPFILPARTN